MEGGHSDQATTRRAISRAIADEIASCGIGMVASLPDDWVADLIKVIDADSRFVHVPVNREESAVGLCSGAFFGEKRAAALMGASGMLTCVYAVTKINYTYEIPMFFLVSMRGAMGDTAKYQISNGLYFLKVLDTIDLPYVLIDRSDKLGEIRRAHRHAFVYNRPTAAIFSREVLRGEA